MSRQRDKKDDKAYKAAVAIGCKPEWLDGIVGWAWHCGCGDLRHAYDSQCSVLKTYAR